MNPNNTWDEYYQNSHPNIPPADPEFERLLAEEKNIQDKADDKIYMGILKNANDELERDLGDISALAMLVSNNRMSAEAAMSIIQTIVG